MPERKLLTVGLGGSLITALCCFTPILVWTLGALGLAAWVGGLDLILLPGLALFLALSVYALTRNSRTTRQRQSR